MGCALTVARLRMSLSKEFLGRVSVDRLRDRFFRNYCPDALRGVDASRSEVGTSIIVCLVLFLLSLEIKVECHTSRQKKMCGT